MTDAFGVVALVALAPLIAIQVMGLIFAYKSKAAAVPSEALTDETVVDLEEDFE